MPRVRTLLRLAALAVVVVSSLSIVRHASALTAIEVQLLEGAEVPEDRAPGAASAPDLRLSVRLGDEWHDLGTFRDCDPRAPLRYELPDEPARDRLVELRLEEDDAVNDDDLERLPVQGDVTEGERFRFTLEERFELSAGLDWFFGTPVGAIAGLLLFITLVGSSLRFGDVG